MLIHHLKLSIRSLKKNRLYSYLNVAGFAVGFAVVMIITLFIYSETRVDNNFRDHENIYRLISATNENDCLHDFHLGTIIRDDYPEVESATPVQYISGWSFNVTHERSFAKLNEVIATDNHFFEIFGLELIEGISSEPFTELNSAVITQSLAAKLFGKESPIGKKINMGGFLEANINGVVKDFPSNSSFSSQIFLNIESESLRIHQSCNDGKCIFPANIYIKLLQENKKELLEEKINRKDDLAVQKSGEFWLQALTDIYFNKEIKNNSNQTANTSIIYLFAGIAALILLLSVFNHVNFSVSLQFSRLRSIGIKKTNGAGFRQLAGFLITENVVAVLTAFIISLGIALLFLPMVNRLFDWHLNALAVVDYPVNLVITLIILTTVAITTIVPLYMMARFDIRKFLSNEIINTRGGGINHVISVFQITASIILVIGVFVIYKQLFFTKHAELGFQKEYLLKVNLPGDFANGDRVKAELSKFPFVKSSTLSMGAPGAITLRTESETEESFWLNNLEVDEDFTKTFGLNLVSGRNFMGGDEEKTCIVNEAALKKFGWNTIDDKTYREYEVIGAVSDFHVTSFHNAIEPAVLVFKDRFKNTLSLRLEPGHTGQQVAQLKQAWEEVVPDQPFDFVFYDEFFGALYQKEERLGQAAGIFSVLAFMITLMGMAGMVFQTCLNKTKEIGIRKVNGAKVWEVMAMLNINFVKWVAIAFIIASPVAWLAMNKWLENFAYKTELSWWVFALAGLVALGIALLTVSWQSWKAATRNPVEALRYE